MAKRTVESDREVSINRYIFAFLCALWVIQIQAQPRLRMPEHYIGVHGGVSASSVNFSPRVENMTPITKACVLGANGGFVFRYAGHKYCALQMELNYVHRGWAESNDTIGTYSRSLHYIEIPMLMHLNFGSQKCRWFLNAGPQLGFCVKDEGNHGVLVNGTGQAEYEPLKNNVDWGILVGTGLYFLTKKAGLYQLEVRFDYSFGGIFGTELTDHFSVASPMDLSLNLAWMWPIQKKQKQKQKQ